MTIRDSHDDFRVLLYLLIPLLQGGGGVTADPMVDKLMDEIVH